MSFETGSIDAGAAHSSGPYPQLSFRPSASDRGIWLKAEQGLPTLEVWPRDSRSSNWQYEHYWKPDPSVATLGRDDKY